MPEINKLTELELFIMKVFWKEGELLVPQLQETLNKQGKELAPSSIRTMLSILMKKGFLDRKGKGRGFIYKAKVEEAKTQKNILKDVISRVFNNSPSSLIAALLNDSMMKESDLDEVTELIKRARGE